MKYKKTILVIFFFLIFLIILTTLCRNKPPEYISGFVNFYFNGKNYDLSLYNEKAYLISEGFVGATEASELGLNGKAIFGHIQLEDDDRKLTCYMANDEIFIVIRRGEAGAIYKLPSTSSMAELIKIVFHKVVPDSLETDGISQKDL